MCYPTPAVLAVQQAIPNSCPAKALPPSQRLQIGLQALTRTQSITDLADSNSRRVLNSLKRRVLRERFS